MFNWLRRQPPRQATCPMPDKIEKTEDQWREIGLLTDIRKEPRSELPLTR